MIESEVFTLISQYGFPIVLSVYLILTRDTIIKKNSEVIQNLADLLEDIYLKPKS